MNLRYLHYLRLVIEHGSFEAAAGAAGVTQPAISHGLKRLEAQFASPLLQRSGRRYLPTELALRVASQGMQLDEQLGALGALGSQGALGASGVLDAPDATGAIGSAAKRMQASPRRDDPGLLRVGLTPSAALVCGPLLHSAWCEGRARRKLLLSSADEGRLLASLQRRELDLVIAPRPRSHATAGVASARTGDTKAVTLYAIKPLVYARRSHSLRQARSLLDLQGAAWASVEPSVRGPVDVLSEAFAVRRLPPPRMVVGCADYASMLNLMLHADLLAVLPHPGLLMGDLHKHIVPLRLRETLPLYDMCLFQPAGSRRAVAALAKRLVQELVDKPIESTQSSRIDSYHLS